MTTHHHSLHHVSFTTSDGPFSVVADERHVLASGWTWDIEALTQLIHPDLRGSAPEVRAGSQGDPHPVLDQAAEAVAAYYAGDITAVDRVPVKQRSGPFREQAWEALRQIPPGAPLTYSGYAARAGRPRAVRAAAGACAMNAAALFVPCHRIVRTDGGLGGFRYGVQIKESLLRRESVPAPSPHADPRRGSPAR
ncbi:methylated-DNA--[protein]-cysteine S-methyltransferase [Nesterenkonia sp. E16_7]|uniref:methylated-DNA--[protein]-cysteine S-methyltransferase n=1 Tax=unclassified Nesterenkonia TaxID=2629769 RepID=UPI001A919206|nr:MULTISPECIES: methylated-DNA--[protein]-cysteine S-methyltransferase [unclassified Nesterenkonia]MBO0595789.1 methylated-DNA--[protein]-cysteine S-methyltransferase [Nesterenkonia sp. E16_10]MBO0599612.1 methylated-DNA--[protein]-cysteine S-methyltransferase [Nesterenkonia sp. E16_7]